MSFMETIANVFRLPERGLSVKLLVKLLNAGREILPKGAFQAACFVRRHSAFRSVSESWACSYSPRTCGPKEPATRSPALPELSCRSDCERLANVGQPGLEAPQKL